jgi:hypothetical protein
MFFIVTKTWWLFSEGKTSPPPWSLLREGDIDFDDHLIA